MRPIKDVVAAAAIGVNNFDSFEFTIRKKTPPTVCPLVMAKIWKTSVKYCEANKQSNPLCNGGSACIFYGC